MTTPTDGENDAEWMSAAEAIGLLPFGTRTICKHAKAGLVKARAKLFIYDGGERRDNADIPTEFWWAEGDEALSQDWRTGHFATWIRNDTVRLEAFGVTFRRSDIEQLKPAIAASPTEPLSPTQRPASSDGEWMSAYEALQFLQQPHAAAATAICSRAYAGMIRAKARRYISYGQAKDDIDVPREFWWAKGGEALSANWATGDFEVVAGGLRVGQLQAFGVEFRRSDIEQMRPALGRPVSPPPSPVEQTSPPETVASRKVFIVHGRDENAKNEVALFLKKIGLEDIVLHQRPNRGRNLLTKFREEAEGSSFAVVLMTPDDDGGLAGEPQKKRARQNVVFELGFFIGKFGTPHVAALVVPGVEKPSDFDGICWIEFGQGTNWKNELARELKEAGIPFDSDAMLHA